MLENDSILVRSEAKIEDIEEFGIGLMHGSKNC
jgi:hypothetical protein